jgi:predicted RND superfamily exporter protein
MLQNVGSADKIVRVVLGLVIIVLAVIYKSWFGVIAIIPLATAAIGWCPAYLPFGISTCRMKNKPKS